MRGIYHGTTLIYYHHFTSNFTDYPTETTDYFSHLSSYYSIGRFIILQAVTRQIVEPMLGFITKVTALRVSGTLADDSPVSSAAFAAPQRLAEVITQVNDLLDTHLPTCVEKMSLYLTGSATREIIFNPIRSNIAEAHSQIATLLEREYQPEDLKRVPLCSPAVLSDMMSKMSSKF